MTYEEALKTGYIMQNRKRVTLRCSSICFDCKNAVPTKDGRYGCLWSNFLIPVDGCKTIKTELGNLITNCPEFIPEDNINMDED